MPGKSKLLRKALPWALAAAIGVSPTLANAQSDTLSKTLVDQQVNLDEAKIQASVPLPYTLDNDVVLRLTDDGLTFLAKVLMMAMIGMVPESRFNYPNDDPKNTVRALLNDSLIGMATGIDPDIFCIQGICIFLWPVVDSNGDGQRCSCEDSAGDYSNVIEGRPMVDCQNCQTDVKDPFTSNNNGGANYWWTHGGAENDPAVDIDNPRYCNPARRIYIDDPSTFDETNVWYCIPPFYDEVLSLYAWNPGYRNANCSAHCLTSGGAGLPGAGGNCEWNTKANCEARYGAGTAGALQCENWQDYTCHDGDIFVSPACLEPKSAECDPDAPRVQVRTQPSTSELILELELHYIKVYLSLSISADPWGCEFAGNLLGCIDTWWDGRDNNGDNYPDDYTGYLPGVFARAYAGFSDGYSSMLDNMGVAPSPGFNYGAELAAGYGNVDAAPSAGYAPSSIGALSHASNGRNGNTNTGDGPAGVGPPYPAGGANGNDCFFELSGSSGGSSGGSSSSSSSSGSSSSSSGGPTGNTLMGITARIGASNCSWDWGSFTYSCPSCYWQTPLSDFCNEGSLNLEVTVQGGGLLEGVCATLVDIAENLIVGVVMDLLKGLIEDQIKKLVEESLGLPLDWTMMVSGQAMLRDDICYLNVPAPYSCAAPNCACNDKNANGLLNYQDHEHAYMPYDLGGAASGRNCAGTSAQISGVAANNCGTDQLWVYGELDGQPWNEDMYGQGMDTGGGFVDTSNTAADAPHYDMGAYFQAVYDTAGVNIALDLSIIPDKQSFANRTCFPQGNAVYDITDQNNTLDNPRKDAGWKEPSNWDVVNSKNMHMVLTMSQQVLNEFIYGLYTSGMLCLNVDSTFPLVGEMLKVDSFRAFIPALGDVDNNGNPIFDQSGNVRMLMRPAGLPEVYALGSARPAMDFASGGDKIPADGINTHTGLINSVYDMMVAMPKYDFEFYAPLNDGSGTEVHLFTFTWDIVLAMAIEYTSAGSLDNGFETGIKRYIEVLMDAYLGCDGKIVRDPNAKPGADADPVQSCAIGNRDPGVTPGNASDDLKYPGVTWNDGIAGFVHTILNNTFSFLIRTQFNLAGMAIHFRKVGNSGVDPDTRDCTSTNPYSAWGCGNGDLLVMGAQLYGMIEFSRIMSMLGGGLSLVPSFPLEPETYVELPAFIGLGDDPSSPGTYYNLSPGQSAAAGITPENAIFNVFGNNIDGTDVQFAYRLDGGVWHPYRYMSQVRFPVLANGYHVLEVKSKDEHTFRDSSPAMVRFWVDSIPPAVRVVDTVGQPAAARVPETAPIFFVKATDNISEDDGLRVRWSLDGGSWHAYSRLSGIPTPRMSPGTEHWLQISVRDEFNNETIETHKFVIDRDAGEGFGCSASPRPAGGSAGSGLAGAMLTVFVLWIGGALLRRRSSFGRTPARLAAFVAVVATLLSGTPAMAKDIDIEFAPRPVPDEILRSPRADVDALPNRFTFVVNGQPDGAAYSSAGLHSMTSWVKRTFNRLLGDATFQAWTEDLLSELVNDPATTYPDPLMDAQMDIPLLGSANIGLHIQDIWNTGAGACGLPTTECYAACTDGNAGAPGVQNNRPSCKFTDADTKAFTIDWTPSATNIDIAVNGATTPLAPTDVFQGDMMVTVNLGKVAADVFLRQPDFPSMVTTGTYLHGIGRIIVPSLKLTFRIYSVGGDLRTRAGTGACGAATPGYCAGYGIGIDFTQIKMEGGIQMDVEPFDCNFMDEAVAPGYSAAANPICDIYPLDVTNQYAGNQIAYKTQTNNQSQLIGEAIEFLDTRLYVDAVRSTDTAVTNFLTSIEVIDVSTMTHYPNGVSGTFEKPKLYDSIDPNKDMYFDYGFAWVWDADANSGIVMSGRAGFSVTSPVACGTPGSGSASAVQDVSVDMPLYPKANVPDAMIGISVHNDLFNSVLHGLWADGGMCFDIWYGANPTDTTLADLLRSDSLGGILVPGLKDSLGDRDMMVSLQPSFLDMDLNPYVQATDQPKVVPVIEQNDDPALIVSKRPLISSEGNFSCAVDQDKRLWCWGNNTYGQIGIGTTVTPQKVPVVASAVANPEEWVATSRVMAVATGLFHTCIVDITGGVYCWGRNNNGQLGDGTTTDATLKPVQPTGLTSGVKDIVAGDYFTCALLTGRTVKCWGLNSSGQLGDNSTTQRTSPVTVVQTGLTTLDKVESISAGQSHMCAFRDSGGVKCWGANGNGQVGDTTTVNKLVATDVSGLTAGAALISTGLTHSCAAMVVGAVKCWGRNNYGQLGDGTTTNRTAPVSSLGLTRNVVGLVAGGQVTCGIYEDGSLKCQGWNANGQIGVGTQTGPNTCADATVTCYTTATSVSGFAPSDGLAVVQMDIGADHSCAVATGAPGAKTSNPTKYGVFKCWGANGNGQIGDNTTTLRSSPTNVAGDLKDLLIDTAWKFTGPYDQHMQIPHLWTALGVDTVGDRLYTSFSPIFAADLGIDIYWGIGWYKVTWSPDGSGGVCSLPPYPCRNLRIGAHIESSLNQVVEGDTAATLADPNKFQQSINSILELVLGTKLDALLEVQINTKPAGPDNFAFLGVVIDPVLGGGFGSAMSYLDNDGAADGDRDFLGFYVTIADLTGANGVGAPDGIADTWDPSFIISTFLDPLKESLTGAPSAPRARVNPWANYQGPVYSAPETYLRLVQADGTSLVQPQIELNTADTVRSGLSRRFDNIVYVDSESAFVGRDDIRYQWRLDRGLYSLPQANSEIRLPMVTDGKHRLEVSAIDREGFIDATPAVLEFVVDTVGPKIRFVGKIPNVVEVNDIRLPIDVVDAVSPRDEIELETRVDNGAWEPWADRFEVSFVNLEPGPHSLQVRGTDPSGNQSLVQTAVTVVGDGGGFGCSVSPEVTGSASTTFITWLFAALGFSVLRRRAARP